MKKLLLTLTLLVVASAASAASFYLLSQQTDKVGPPLPVNPQIHCPSHRIVEDIWLVDDSAMVATTNTVAEVLPRLRGRIEQAQIAAAWYLLTNPPPPVAEIKVTRVVTNWFASSNMGLSAVLLKDIRPDLYTNLTAEQIAFPPVRTNQGFHNQEYRQIPDYINRDLTNWQELFQEWKLTNGFGSEKPIKGSGGGDYQFYDVNSYQINLRPQSPPTGQGYPNWDATNGFTWPKFKPVVVGWASISNLAFVRGFSSNSMASLTPRIFDYPSFGLLIQYPDAVCREPANSFASVEINLWGECADQTPFNVTNVVDMSGGICTLTANVEVHLNCISVPKNWYAEAQVTSQSGPSQAWWHSLPPVVPAIRIRETAPWKTIDLGIPGAGFASAQIQSVPTAAATNWQVITTLNAGASGYMEASFEMTNGMEFYRVIGL